MIRDNADPPIAVGGLEGIVDGLDYLFLLAHEDATWVGLFAAVELKQQIQSREAEGFDMRAAAWACAGKNVCNAIAVAIVDSNPGAACEIFCVGHEL
jgi:hypothetical protein